MLVVAPCCIMHFHFLTYFFKFRQIRSFVMSGCSLSAYLVDRRLNRFAQWTRHV
jgi:hypothetical protein